MYEEISEAIRQMIQMAVPDKRVVHGSMPPLSGIACSGFGAPVKTDWKVGTIQRFDFVINTKSDSLQEGIQALDKVHTWLTIRKDFPAGEKWQIFNISSSASPRLVGKEENGKWLIGSSINASVYIKGI